MEIQEVGLETTSDSTHINALIWVAVIIRVETVRRAEIQDYYDVKTVKVAQQ